MGSYVGCSSQGLLTHPPPQPAQGTGASRSRVVTKATNQIVRKRPPALPQMEGGISSI